MWGQCFFFWDKPEFNLNSGFNFVENGIGFPLDISNRLLTFIEAIQLKKWSGFGLPAASVGWRVLARFWEHTSSYMSLRVGCRTMSKWTHISWKEQGASNFVRTISSFEFFSVQNNLASAQIMILLVWFMKV